MMTSIDDVSFDNLGCAPLLDCGAGLGTTAFQATFSEWDDTDTDMLSSSPHDEMLSFFDEDSFIETMAAACVDSNHRAPAVKRCRAQISARPSIRTPFTDAMKRRRCSVSSSSTSSSSPPSSSLCVKVSKTTDVPSSPTVSCPVSPTVMMPVEAPIRRRPSPSTVVTVTAVTCAPPSSPSPPSSLPSSPSPPPPRRRVRYRARRRCGDSHSHAHRCDGGSGDGSSGGAAGRGRRSGARTKLTLDQRLAQLHDSGNFDSYCRAAFKEASVPLQESLINGMFASLQTIKNKQTRDPFLWRRPPLPHGSPAKFVLFMRTVFNAVLRMYKTVIPVDDPFRVVTASRDAFRRRLEACGSNRGRAQYLAGELTRLLAIVRPGETFTIPRDCVAAWGERLATPPPAEADAETGGVRVEATVDHCMFILCPLGSLHGWRFCRSTVHKCKPHRQPFRLPATSFQSSSHVRCAGAAAFLAATTCTAAV